MSVDLTALPKKPSWIALQSHWKEIGSQFSMKEAFDKDPSRFSNFSLTWSPPNSNNPHILLDYSKNLVTSQTMSLLFDVAKETQVESKRNQMMTGEKINTTEDRYSTFRFSSVGTFH